MLPSFNQNLWFLREIWEWDLNQHKKKTVFHLKAIRVDVVEVLHSTGDVVPIVERVDEIKAKISNITLTTTKISQFLRKPRKVLADNNWHHRRKSFMPDSFCAIFMPDTICAILCHFYAILCHFMPFYAILCHFYAIFMPFLCHLFSLAHHKRRLK